MKLYTDTVTMEYYLTQRYDRYKPYVNEMMNLYRHIHEDGYTLVEFHKRKLGRQAFCWVGVVRFWVWQEPNCQVLVSNKKGICFEVRRDASQPQSPANTKLEIDIAVCCWELYLAKMKRGESWSSLITAEIPTTSQE